MSNLRKWSNELNISVLLEQLIDIMSITWTLIKDYTLHNSLEDFEAHKNEMEVKKLITFHSKKLKYNFS